MTRGAGGELHTRLYQSSIFQALSSRPLLPCGLRVAVTHLGSQQHCAFITYGVHACPHTPAHILYMHPPTQKHTQRGNSHKSYLSPIDLASTRLSSIYFFVPPFFSCYKKKWLNCKIPSHNIPPLTSTVSYSFSKTIRLQRKKKQLSFSWYHSAIASPCHGAAYISAHTHIEIQPWYCR